MTTPLMIASVCALLALAAVVARRLDIALKVESRLGLPFFWRLG